MNETYGLMGYKVNTVSVKRRPLSCALPPAHHRDPGPAFSAMAPELVLLGVLARMCPLDTVGWAGLAIFLGMRV